MRRALLLPAAIATALVSTSAHAATALYSLAIGYNGVAPQTADTSTLHFADDDALAVHELARVVARRSEVLTIPDRPTQERFASAKHARPPSLSELRRVLAELRGDIERTTRAGDEVAVWFFYSGHGYLNERGKASLTLADGALSQEVLYDEVLPALAGRPLHLLIDACHAEALIRPRDLTAGTVEVSEWEVASASLRARLGNLPNVGVVMASASNTQAHEWDDYQSGVFTHELLSGLRGGADVSGDGRVEYSEIAAFLTAANRSVTDPRAHLTTLVVAPKLYPRAAIVDIGQSHVGAHLRGRAHHLGRFEVADGRGVRLLDLRAEPGFAVNVLVPAGERLLISNEVGEADVWTSADRTTDLEGLSLAKRSTRSRGVVAESMRRGLFASAFGPAYYQGFVDNADLIPVELPPAGVHLSPQGTAHAVGHRAAWTAFALGGAALAASGVFGVLSMQAYRDYQSTDLERPSVVAGDHYASYGVAALAALAGGALSMGIGYWLWNR